LEIEWILVIHNNYIFPYYGYNIEIVMIYYGFSGAIANFIARISHFFPSATGLGKNIYMFLEHILLGRIQTLPIGVENFLALLRRTPCMHASV
jgi:hypothetical protein